MSTLHTHFDPRRNSLDVIRLTLALAVAVSHAVVMQSGRQPMWGESSLGDFAVDGFFILSGFLVTRSYLNLDNFWRFGWHRFLRIMPGFWVCLVVTGLVVAPLAAVLGGQHISTPFTQDPTALRYILANAGLLITQYDIGGLLASNPNPSVFDGSLWTLIFEAACYVLVAALGVVGLLRRLPLVAPVLAGLMLIFNVLHEVGVDFVIGDNLSRMTFVFLLGATAHLFARRIPMSGWLALVALLIFVASVALFDDYRLTGAVPFAFLLLWLVSRFPWPARLPMDLSYGVYIYHWPILQLMALTLLRDVSPVIFVLVGLAVSLLVALPSWLIVEKKALSRKDSELPNRVAAIFDRLRRRARVG